MERSAVARGRKAFDDGRWKAALESLIAADQASPLEAGDLERLGNAAYLAGQDAQAASAWTRGYDALVSGGDYPRAARLGFWLSFALLFGGNPAQSRGWLNKTQRMLDDAETPCAERGLLLVLDGLFKLFGGAAADAAAQFERATALAQEHADSEVLAVSILSHGQALVQMQRVEEGIALLDEAMVAVTSGAVTPIMAGVIYCAVILTCESVHDLHRAHEWTVALDQWCGKQSELIAFRGQCLVHRAELLQFKGDWTGAREEARRAREFLPERSGTLAARAMYRQAELYRLTGDYEQAEKHYQLAGAKGFEPQPGLSMLRLAQGDVESATAAVRRVVGEAGTEHRPSGGPQRVKVLGAYVAIMLASDDLSAACAAAEELEAIALDTNAPVLKATAAQARGTVSLAGGEPEQALASLREAWMIWQQLDAPFESASVRVLIGRACVEVGDAEAGKMHFAAAAAVLERLGASPDAVGLRYDKPRRGDAVDSLSARERQVLTVVAMGKTNRQIAAELGISEHTVARHMSNIFNKLGVTTRTAASAFAFDRDLV
jgi:DNA-binding CsgD family transcriptional regulator